MENLSDWGLLLQPNLFLLALPGLLAGIVLTLASRNTQSAVTLPISMVVIPTLFYLFIFSVGWGIDGAREHKLVGDKSEPGMLDFKYFFSFKKKHCFVGDLT